MSTDHTHNPAVLAIKLASLAAVMAVVVGITVLVGGAFDIAVLKSISPGWIAMKANTAACFILIGVALLLVTRSPVPFNPQRSTFLSHLARLCGALPVAGILKIGTSRPI